MLADIDEDEQAAAIAAAAAQAGANLANAAAQPVQANAPNPAAPAAGAGGQAPNAAAQQQPPPPYAAVAPGAGAGPVGLNAAQLQQMAQNQQFHNIMQNFILGMPQAAAAAVAAAANAAAGQPAAGPNPAGAGAVAAGPNPAAAAPAAPHVGRARAKITPFNSTNAADWREFRQRVNTARELDGWTDQEGKQMVRTLCEGVAAKRMMNVAVGGNPDLVPPPADAKTYEEYMNDVQLRFQHREASALAIADFQKARMRPDEDYLNWHVRLHDVHCMAYPTRDQENDPDLIRQFILGLQDQMIQDHLMEREPQSYQDCLAWAQSKQGKLAQVRQSRNRPRINAIEAMDSSGSYDGYDYGYEDYCINAINYDTGARKRTTTAQNKHLRRFGPGGMKGQRCSHCESFDHATTECHFVKEEVAQVGRRNRFGRGNYGGGNFGNGRGNRRGRGNSGNRGRGGRYMKGRGMRKDHARRGNAYAVGDDDSLHALEDCLERLVLESQEGN